MNTDDVQENLPEPLQDVEFQDRLELLGLVTGAFLVLAGLGTVAGTPWTHKASIAASVIQVLGALGTAGIGAGLIWLVRTEN
jgi:hypothetical protein